MPEAGGRVDFASEHDEQTMTMLGLSSKREVTRTSIRVQTAMAAQTRDQAGCWAPDYEQGISVAGYHLHFIDSGHAHGGHALDYRLERGRIEISSRSELHLSLPRTPQFLDSNLTPANISGSPGAPPATASGPAAAALAARKPGTSSAWPRRGSGSYRAGSGRPARANASRCGECVWIIATSTTARWSATCERSAASATEATGACPGVVISASL
jgi:hypothetical protein